jgi:hypothetical protein
VSWDPTLRYLALAYLRQVQIFRAQPQLESLGSLPIAGTTSVAWGVRQLYISTPTSVLLVFVAAEERSGAAFSLLDMGPPDKGATGSTLQVRPQGVAPLLTCLLACLLAWLASC